MNGLLTLTEAAEIKGVSRQAIYKAIEKGNLKGIKVRVSEYRVRRTDLDKYQPNPNMKRAGRPRREAR
jgi:excisionase family DNA binding protein